MPKDFYDQLVTLMRAAGCNPINNRTVTAPRSKSRHTANEVLKQLGIGKKL